MIYKGNYLDKIPLGLIDAVLHNEGNKTPVYQPEKWVGHEKIERALQKVEKAGYNKLDRNFYQFTQDTPCIELFVNDLQWVYSLEENYKECHWWIVKYNAGDMQPMHIDPHVIWETEVIRYTLMLTDYVDGHVFVYNNNKFLKDYVAGDLFLWKNSSNYHGATNVSHIPRISLQVSFIR